MTFQSGLRSLAARRPVLLTASTAAVGALFIAVFPGAADAAPTSVTDYAGLSAAVQSGHNVVLGADITHSGDTLDVPSSVSIDLNGHDLSLTGAAGGAAIDESTGTRLAINDLVGGGSLAATGGSGSAGIRVSTGAQLVLHARSIVAKGGSGGAGIGGSTGQNGGTVKVVLGSEVTATGGTGAAGIGGGSHGNGGNVQVNGGQVTATGGTGGAGIGGGTGGNGGTLGVNQSSFVIAKGGSGAAGVGAGAGGGAGSGSVKIATNATLEVGDGGSGASAITLGSLTNAGILRIRAGSNLRVPTGVTAENTGLIRVLGSITGTGTIHNAGTILNTKGQLVADTGQGPAGSALLITEHNYTVEFSLDGSPGTPPTTLNVYAADIATSKQSLPAVPTTPGLTCAAGWFTSATRGTQVTNTTTLSTVAAYGPSTLVLHRHCTATGSSTPPVTSTPPASSSSGTSTTSSTTAIATTSSTLAATGADTGSQVGLALLVLLGGLGLLYAGRSRATARHGRRH